MFKENEVEPAGQPVVTFRSSEMKVQADIPEEDILKITVGATVRVKFKALPQTVFLERVDAIAAQEVNKEGDISYRADITSSEFAPELRSGMTAKVIINSTEQTSPIRIPSKFITWRNNHSYVTVVDGEKQQSVEIETGATDGDFVEVSNGLREGQVLLFKN